MTMQTVEIDNAKEGDWAFWHYDGYPGWLGGKIGGLPTSYAPRPMVDTKDGRVWIGSYLAYFRPGFILRVAEGEALYKRLKALEAKSRTAHAEVHRLMKQAKVALAAETGLEL